MKIYNVLKVPQGLGYDEVDYDALYQSGYTTGHQSGYTDGLNACFSVYPTEIEDNEGTGGTYTIEIVTGGIWTASWDGMMPGSNWCTFSPSSGEGSGQITLTLQPFENPEGDYELPRVGDLTVTNSKGESAVVQVNQRPQAPEPPLTFEILSDGILYWKVESYLSATVATIEYSKDSGNTWVSVSSTLEGRPISVYTGEIIQFRGFSSAGTYGSTFSGSTPEFRVYGNIMSLIYGDDFRGQTVIPDTGRGRSFGRLFQFCTGLTDAQELKLPATSLVTDCYSFMFWGDTSLVTAPKILPATTLTGWCYAGMFSGCTSLQTAPELPAPTLVGDCYRGMFSNCSTLNYIKCLATTDVITGFPASALNNWVNGVSSTGTFVAKVRYWPRGNSGIPNNWTIEIV